MTLKNLGLNQALRYFFSGTIFVSSAYYGYGLRLSDLNAEAMKGAVAALALVALTAGASVYVLYRSVFYNLLSRLAHWLAGKLDTSCPESLMRFLPFCITSSEFKIDCWRWKLSDSTGQGANPAHSFVAEWGSQIHMCYTFVLSIWLGSLTGSLLAHSCSFDWLLFWISVGTFVVGIISHIRLKHMELRLKRERTLTKCRTTQCTRRPTLRSGRW